MRLDEYQTAAQATEIHAAQDPVAFLLLGMIGEAGVLSADYKKHLRDRSSIELFRQRASEEIGDLLWYTSSLASALGLSLDDIANENLRKATQRWMSPIVERPVLDRDAPEEERFPRHFQVDFLDTGAVVRISDAEGNQLGAKVDDNAHVDDGYRFHGSTR